MLHGDARWCSGHAWACMGVLRHARACKGVHGRVEACTGVLRHARACKGLPQFLPKSCPCLCCIPVIQILVLPKSP